MILGIDFADRFGSSHFCSSLSLLLGCAFSYSVTTISDGPERLDAGRGARRMVAVDPRPETQSEQWPKQKSGAAHQCREDASAAKVLESATEDGATKAGLETALRHVKEQNKAGQVSSSRAPVPEVTFEAAGSGCRSWKQLTSLWQISRPGSRCFASSSDRAKVAAVAPPLNVQVVESDPKISCARQWRSSFSRSTRGSPTSRTPSPQAMQPKSV